MQKEITINIPFSYELDEVGFHSGKVLKTVADMKDEIRAELEAGVLTDGSEIMFTVENEKVLKQYIERLKDMKTFMTDCVGTEWDSIYYDFKSYTPTFDDFEDQQLFNIKLGELITLKEILGL